MRVMHSILFIFFLCRWGEVYLIIYWLTNSIHSDYKLSVSCSLCCWFPVSTSIFLSFFFVQKMRISRISENTRNKQDWKVWKSEQKLSELVWRLFFTFDCCSLVEFNYLRCEGTSVEFVKGIFVSHGNNNNNNCKKSIKTYEIRGIFKTPPKIQSTSNFPLKIWIFQVFPPNFLHDWSPNN